MIQEPRFARLLAICLTLAAIGLPAAASADAKIAVIRQEPLAASPLFKEVAQKLNTEFTKRGTDLETQKKQLEEDAKKYERDRAILSPDAQVKTEKDLGNRQIDLQQAYRKFQDDGAARQRDLQIEFNNKVRDAVYAIAKEKAYDLVLVDPVYNSSALDITDDVLKRLAATTAAPTPAPKPAGK